MRRILIDNCETDLTQCSFGFPWKHDSICYNFRRPDVFILANDIENIADVADIETVVIGCELENYDFIADMVNLRQLYIYDGRRIVDLQFIEKLLKLQQLYIQDSHVENLEGLVHLIDEKKKYYDQEDEFWEKIEYGMEGICIMSDGTSNSRKELLAPGLFITEIIV